MVDREMLERDLAQFSDPATKFEFKAVLGRARARLVRHGEDRTYFINLEDGTIYGQHNKQNHQSLKALLASEEFADLRGFAATQRRVLASKELDSLIDPAGLVNPDARGSTDLTLALGRKLTSPIDSDDLNILLIDGPAGVGKTSFIERMVYERADDVTTPPILHITSKGRRLSHLLDAIGRTANDLQADFRTDQVPVLARLNALQVAFDGFDELVQEEGYGRAWAALQDFVRIMAKGGPLILAGRDTFFDQQGARQALDRFGIKVNLTMVRLHEVTVPTAKSWLRKRGWTQDNVSSPELSAFLQRPYTRRPFFLSHIAQYKHFADIPTERGSPQAILIDELLTREIEILSCVFPNIPSERIRAALDIMFEEMANDMAEREADSVPRENVEFYCDIAFEGIVGSDNLPALRHRIGSVALIESDENRADLRFPHTEIQNYFLARAAFRSFIKNRTFIPLRSVNFSIDFIEAFADVIRIAPGPEYDSVVTHLQRYSMTNRTRCNSCRM